MNKIDFLNDPDVEGFIEYFANIINGSISIEHSYLDRKLRKTLEFKSLYSGLEQYQWNDIDFQENKVEIDVLVSKFKSSSSADSFYDACVDTLYWGDGNRKGSLYTHNKNWLDQLDCVRSNILQALNVLTKDELDVSLFKSQYRSNAGFTKIYAFIRPEEFIIYDSRVAAALAYFIILYCESKQYESVPRHLQIRVAEAKGNSCRVFNVAGLKFKKWTNSQNHAESNVFANWIITEAFKKARKSKSNQFNDIREIEAALFMIGYDFPELKKDVNAISTETQPLKKKTNHQALFDFIESNPELMPKTFNYESVLALASKFLGSATKSGQQYASLKFIQHFCNALDEDISHQLSQASDPRKIESIDAAKTKCLYELK